MTRRAEDRADPHTDAAVDWLMRRQRGPLSDAEMQAFEAWLGAAPENRQAYEEVEWLWGAAGAAEGQPRIEARRRWVLRSVEWSRPSRRAMAAAHRHASLGRGGPRPSDTRP